ncbi:MAG TPA: hypothetical protein VH186_32040 [Chloroflexia bacterium]|nr:hypothetical protein [Chloroflexia bacterium]
MEPDYSVSYIANPFNQLKANDTKEKDWQEWDLAPRAKDKTSQPVRYSRLEIEMPNWLDDLIDTHHSQPEPAVTGPRVLRNVPPEVPAAPVAAITVPQKQPGFWHRLGHWLHLD